MSPAAYYNLTISFACVKNLALHRLPFYNDNYEPGISPVQATTN